MKPEYWAKQVFKVRQVSKALLEKLVSRVRLEFQALPEFKAKQEYRVKLVLPVKAQSLTDLRRGGTLAADDLVALEPGETRLIRVD